MTLNEQHSNQHSTDFIRKVDVSTKISATKHFYREIAIEISIRCAEKSASLFAIATKQQQVHATSIGKSIFILKFALFTCVAEFFSFDF